MRETPKMSVMTPMTDGMVDLTPLKAVVRRLPSRHPLRLVVLAEPDWISRRDYVAKAEVWCRLLRHVDGNHTYGMAGM